MSCTQETFEKLPPEDKGLIDTLVTTHWAPSFSVHPRTGDSEPGCSPRWLREKAAAACLTAPVRMLLAKKHVAVHAVSQAQVACDRLAAASPLPLACVLPACLPAGRPPCACCLQKMESGCPASGQPGVHQL